MRYLSLCSGIEAATVAWHPLGWTPVAFSEIEKFPCALLERRWPGVPNLGDMTAPDFVDRAKALGPIDLVVGGTPCFPDGALVLTKRGLLPIERVVIGDEVVTHKGRWRKVVRVGFKTATTVIVKGQGHPGMEATPNHPFWSTKRTSKTTRRKGKSIRITDFPEPSWTAATDMAGRHWSTPASFPESEPPEIALEGNDRAVPPFSEAFWRVVGAWVGDGWTRQDDRRGCLVFGIGASKTTFLESCLAEAELLWGVSKERTVLKYFVHSRPLARWIVEHFGQYAHGKRLPAWIFGMKREWRRAFLDGYLATDGTSNKSCRGHRIATVSRELAFGTRILACTLGHSSSVALVVNKRERCVIEGRVVNESPYYTVTVGNSDRSSFERDGQRFALVRSVKECRQLARVHNLEVEEDHSYTVDGIVVKNCQAFSVAGLRKSLEDERGNLTLKYVEIIHAIKPRWFVWENVPGVLNTKDNAFGCFLAGLAGEGAPLSSGLKGGKWDNAGLVIGKEYSLAWRVQDAQHHGVPQRRRRVFVVGHLGVWTAAAKVLLECQGLPGDSSARRKARKGSAGETVPSLVASGQGVERVGDSRGQDPVVVQPLNDLDEAAHALTAANTATGRLDPTMQDFVEQPEVVHTLKGEGFDASEDGTGRGVPLVPEVYNMGSDGQAHEADKSPTIDARAKDGPRRNQGGTIVMGEPQKPIGFYHTNRQPENGNYEDQSPAVKVGTSGKSGLPPAMATNEVEAFKESQSGVRLGDVHPTLDANKGSRRMEGVIMPESAEEKPVIYSIMPQNSGKDYKAKETEDAQPLMAAGPTTGNQGGDYVLGNSCMIVRRLTPCECERLQGFPDSYTLIDLGKKAPKEHDEEDIAYIMRSGKSREEAERLSLCPDGPRYKALGNSMAVPCMRWIGERIQAIEEGL